MKKSKKIREVIGATIFIIGFGGVAGLAESNANIFGCLLAFGELFFGTLLMYWEHFSPTSEDIKHKKYDKDIFDLSA